MKIPKKCQIPLIYTFKRYLNNNQIYTSPSLPSSLTVYMVSDPSYNMEYGCGGWLGGGARERNLPLRMKGGGGGVDERERERDR